MGLADRAANRRDTQRLRQIDEALRQALATADALPLNTHAARAAVVVGRALRQAAASGADRAELGRLVAAMLADTPE